MGCHPSEAVRGVRNGAYIQPTGLENAQQMARKLLEAGQQQCGMTWGGGAVELHKREGQTSTGSEICCSSNGANVATVLIAPVPRDVYGEGTAAAVKEELKALNGAHVSFSTALRDLLEPRRSRARWPRTRVADKEFVMWSPVGHLEARG